MAQDVQSAIESSAALKTTIVGSGPASALYVTSQSCAIDYSSAHVMVPLFVSVLAGVYTSILIYEKIKNR